MANPSNLYAEKIYSEHPLALWALDDKADYISLITEAERDILDEWTVTGGTATTSSVGLLNDPFIDSVTTSLEGDVPTGTTADIVCVGPGLINFTDLNSTLGTFCVGAYFYSNSAYLQSVSIGYEYTDTTTALVVQHLKTFNTQLFQSWGFVSETFEIPNESANLRPVIKITYTDGGAVPSDYQFYINGVTVGQWSEEFNTTSLGIEPTSVDTNIAIDSSDGIQAEAYGVSGQQGYYLVENNALVAKNSSVPLVFGASGVTRLIEKTNGQPSLIIPGKGFLNKLGQFKEYTIEFWARINSDSYTPKRIFGPIASTDGLYVEGGFLTLVIGKSFASYFVGEWFRPMLIDIRLIRNSASVLVNGEQVISLTIDTDNLNLPNEFNESDKEQDWLGFYAYSDVTPIEIDCIAIYSYQVPTTVAKRRWVYGQAVLSPESINSAYGGTQAFIDYAFADYTANYNYPDFATWEQGTFDNLTTTNTALSTPNYQLPTIFINNQNLQELYDDNKTINNTSGSQYTFFTFRPNNDWDGVDNYFNFNNFNVLNEEVKAVYGVFSNDDITGNFTLFKIRNKINGDYFLVEQVDDEIEYSLTISGASTSLYTTDTISANEIFGVGINIQDLVTRFGGNISTFFGNKASLELYVGGDDGENLSSGRIYSFGLSTALNAIDLQDHFENGFIILQDGEDLIPFTASYTLLPAIAYDTFFLDIGVAGYWEDYLPLSYFAQYVNNDQGDRFYDIDFLQLNLGYPAPSKLTESETTGSWTYAELVERYANPVQRTYAQLDNNLFTGWNNYEDMQEKSAKYYQYDTEDASIRSYITFQYVRDGANAPKDTFTTIEPAKEGSIIDVDNYPNWETTKFEVVNNTLIYPTKTIDFNDLAIVYHLDFNIRGILSKPIALRRFELASQAFNDNSFNPVGTRFGTNLFPYKRAGLYYDYKSKNPFSIYKGSTPYLYLTRNSGIQVRGDFDPLIDRGISLPVNQSKANNYRVSATQIWMRYDEDDFPLTEVPLFEINHRADTVQFYLVADSETGSRAKIYAKKKSDGSEFNGISYYLNGSLVREPVITVKEWSVLGVAFASALNFDGYLGNINLNGPMIFNNIAYYQANNLQQVQSTLTRPWSRVVSDGVTNFEWQYWLNNFTWDGVLVISASDAYGVNPSDVYKTYVGTNKIIVDDNEGMLINPDKLKIYQEVTWSITTNSPV